MHEESIGLCRDAVAQCELIAPAIGEFISGAAQSFPDARLPVRTFDQDKRSVNREGIGGSAQNCSLGAFGVDLCSDDAVYGNLKRPAAFERRVERLNRRGEIIKCQGVEFFAIHVLDLIRANVLYKTIDVGVGIGCRESSNCAVVEDWDDKGLTS